VLIFTIRQADTAMTIDTTPFGDVPTSVDVHGGLLAIASAKSNR
jgi:hypothetical protein